MGDPLRRVDIAELRGFCAAVELGSLSAAARSLALSQPALSKRVRELEALAGTRLLERSSRGVTPTPAGSKLHEQARSLLAQAERVDALLCGLRGAQAPLRLAASHTIAEFVLPAALARYEAGGERQMAVELLVANSKVVRELVAEGKADLGIAAIDPDEDHRDRLEQLDLCEDEVIVAVSAGHPWSGLREISLVDFLRTPMVMRDPSANTRRVVEAALRQHGMNLAGALAEVGSTAGVIAAVLSENSPALISALALRASEEGMVARRVSGIRFPRRFVILHERGEGLRADARRLIEHLRSRVGP